ncbi:MAG: Fe-S cluster assembly sulfur transfer protein SufU [Myxococcota bacterium]
MTDDLDALYDAAIVARAKEARRSRVPEAAAHRAKCVNELCGDRVEVGLVLEGERVTEVGFKARGCALSLAAAQALKEALEGRSRAEAAELVARFRAALETGPDEASSAAPELAPFLAVRRFPSRVRCATLAWEAADAALDT